ncbi:MAG TPA: acyl-CoA dehydrogenase family protein [Solirubrobacter sp.]|nr:acyl-CoA dehydrogenase family protein [Solirubrobacter sp.]
MIDFSHPPAVQELAERTRAFVDAVCVPAEARDRGGHGLDPDLRAELQAAAKDAGIFAPQVAAELGGHGLDLRGQAAVLEAAGRSLLGPQALNCAAPDEGNMHLLHEIATPEQRERYLVPLAAGETRSSFSMTEPPPGAGSDPSMLRTTATKIDGGWVIDGHKWFITGAEGAAFSICMARTSDAISGGRGATMFLVDADNPGMRLERVIDAQDRGFAGGHGEVVFERCEVADDAVLGAVGEGYRYAQVRLVGGRLTHCMRWTGLAARAFESAVGYVNQRHGFGGPLAGQGIVQQMLADSHIDLETSRLLILRAAWEVDTGGGDGIFPSSVAKAHVAEAVHRVVDRAVQLCGATGVSGDAPLSRFLAEVRPFRIYDGPTETHKWSIGRRLARARA